MCVLVQLLCIRSCDFFFCREILVFVVCFLLNLCYLLVVFFVDCNGQDSWMWFGFVLVVLYFKVVSVWMLIVGLLWSFGDLGWCFFFFRGFVWIFIREWGQEEFCIVQVVWILCGILLRWLKMFFLCFKDQEIWKRKNEVFFVVGFFFVFFCKFLGDLRCYFFFLG